MRAAIAIVVFAALGVSSSVPAEERFRVTGRVEAQTRSADGRYTLIAEARYTPEQQSKDRRFVLKASAGAACAPFPDALFRDEFE
jgi:uncharacterized protein with FMN-binding domain